MPCRGRSEPCSARRTDPPGALITVAPTLATTAASGRRTFDALRKPVLPSPRRRARPRLRSPATEGGAAAAVAVAAQPEAAAIPATSRPSTIASPAPPVATPGAATPSSAEPAATAVISSPAQPQDRSAATAQAQPQALDTSRGSRTSGRRSQPPAAPVVPQFGLTGPLSWPNAFEDVLGYTFWPKDYEQRLRAHGFGDLVAAIFRPAVAPAQAARADTSHGRGSDTAGRPAAGLCGGEAHEPVDWPGRRLEQAGSLNDKQRAALGALRTAVTDAVKSIRTACREEVGLAPPARLISMQATLWGVHDASLLVRAPLQAFYDSLSDEQKAAFVVKQQPVPQQPAAADPRAERMRAASMARPKAAARTRLRRQRRHVGDDGVRWRGMVGRPDRADGPAQRRATGQHRNAAAQPDGNGRISRAVVPASSRRNADGPARFRDRPGDSDNLCGVDRGPCAQRPLRPAHGRTEGAHRAADAVGVPRSATSRTTNRANSWHAGCPRR